jgi:TolB-like protein
MLWPTFATYLISVALIQELKRRNVFRVGIAYAVGAWVLLQVLDVVGEILDLPAWGGKLILAILVVGFFIALIVAWAFELTPEGIKRESEVDRSQSITVKTGRKLNTIIIALLSLAIAYLLLDKFYLAPLLVDPDGTTDEVQYVQDLRHPEEGQPAPKTSRRSIAVLPFANMSGDPAQEFFSDGISEELLNVLASIEGLKVASRTSSFTFRDGVLGIPEIAAKLGVAFVLEGSVRRAGHRVRITAQLIDAARDQHLWSDTYDRSLDDIFAIQSEIANAIADALREPMGLEIDSVPVVVTTEDISAYELYLKGRDAWNRRSNARQLEEGIAALEAAVELDPGFMDAWQYLAALYWAAPYWGLTDHDLQEYTDKASRAIEQAIELGGLTAFSATFRASVKAVKYDSWGQTYLDDLDQALALDPDFITAIHFKGNTYIEAGLFEEGIRYQDRCLDLDPYYVNCLQYKSNALFYLERYEEAEDALVEYLEKSHAGVVIESIPFAVEVGDIKTALLMGQMLPNFAEAPMADWVKAMHDPRVSKQLVLKRWDAWSSRTGQPIPSIVFATLDAPERIQGVVDHWVWLPMLHKFRQSPRFRAYLTVFKDVWQTGGYPPQCRPIHEDEFECD